jgi:hypothetical protein
MAICDRDLQQVSKRHMKKSVFLPSSTKERKLILRRRGNPAPACRRETELGCNAHHDLRLPVGDRKIRRLYRKPGRRLHHGPILLDLFHRFGPHPVGPAIRREGSPIEIGYQVSFDSSPARRAHSRCAAGLSSGGHSGKAGSGRGSCAFKGRFPGLPVKALILVGLGRRPRIKEPDRT